ncbi:MAG TPA: EamA family transporter [Rhizomicrobium sp.]|nr:EamA family transporter [Rhizomicrobium sp.]
MTWVLFTLLGAAGQTARNAMQRELTPRLGALGATLVRFLFGFPFALLFLSVVLWWTGAALPAINRDFALWTLLGALTQIGGTALMLMTMEQRSFVVTVAYLKTEPVLVAAMGLVFLGDPLTVAMALAILVAMAGVALISVKPEALAGGRFSIFKGPALLGLSSAALFAASAIGYRGAILSLHQASFVLGATFSLAAGLTVQTPLLLIWLVLFNRATLNAILALWRPSLLAGFSGAAASQCWFLAFALATAASVRTLALVEVLFAQGVTHFVFRQKTSFREVAGIILLLAGAVLIVWVNPQA